MSFHSPAARSVTFSEKQTFLKQMAVSRTGYQRIQCINFLIKC